MKKGVLLIAIATLITSCGGQAKKDDGKVVYSETTWQWNKIDSGYTANAVFKYESNRTFTVPATVNDKIMTEKTCLSDGLIRYTATATFGGVTVSDYKDEVIPATGHDFDHYTFDDEYHYHTCACGEVSEKAAHTFGEEQVIEAPDGWKTPGRKMKECSVCHYQHFEAITPTDEYRKQVISGVKKALDDFGDLPKIDNAYRMLKENEVNQIYEYLTREEIFNLEESYLRKLLSVMFDYSKATDVDNNENMTYIASEGEDIVNSVEVTDDYGPVSVVKVNAAIANRKKPEDGKNPIDVYGHNLYRSFTLDVVPKISSKDKEMVMYVNAPYDVKIAFNGFGTKVNGILYVGGKPVGMDYFVFDKTKSSEEEAKGYLQLKQGWNTVVFDEANTLNALNRDLFKFQMDVIDDNGIQPGTWKFSSLLSKSEETYQLYEKLEALPNLDEVCVSDYFTVNDLYDSYFGLSRKADQLFQKGDLLSKLRAKLSTFTNLPYGSYNLPSDMDSTLYETERGKCFKLDITKDTTGQGVLHGSNVRKLEGKFDCMGLYVKGYNGHLSLFNPTNSTEILSFERVALDDEWSLYMLNKDQIESVKDVDFGTISWYTLYLKFTEKISAGTTLYQSLLFSFDVVHSEYNKIVEQIPDNDSDLRYSHKPLVDGAYSLLSNMKEEELQQCEKVERIKKLHEDFPIKGIDFKEIKEQINIPNVTKNDWNHHNGRAVYYQLTVGEYTLELPKVAYNFYQTFIYEGEMQQGILVGFSSTDHYEQSSGGGVKEFFTVTISCDSNNEYSINIKVYATADGDSPDFRDWKTYRDVIYDQTRSLTDADIINGEKSLNLFVKMQYSWNNQFIVGGAEMNFKE